MTEHVDTHESLTIGSDEDALLAQVLEKYLADVEAGCARPATELVAEYPQLAGRLEACLASLRFVIQAGVDMGDTAFVKTLEDRGATLGDFRIVRELGRGGMGIVYEAEQLSLRRRVALKILPFAAVLDDRRLQRFKNEALAAAQLKHPNIVSVFSVGCERSVHYYAMEYVEGQSLDGFSIESGVKSKEPEAADGMSRDSCQESIVRAAETAPIAAVSTLHGPSSQLLEPAERCRQIAHLGIQAAEALHYAHEMGIVHRDIKPSNLMVDYRGHLWITDFGLATTQTGAGLTMTGDLLGTLRYMSPEQAAGDRAKTDYRTDIYSLGITLYELLTRKCAFADSDRHVLLRRIMEDDLKPPRSIDPTIPRDLETIVLKATAKEVGDRYRTAGELASDLNRFTAGKSIEALRPSWIDLGLRWSRRNIVAVWTLMVATLCAVALLSFIVIRETRLRKALQTQKDRADENIGIARHVIADLLGPASTGLEGRVSTGCEGDGCANHAHGIDRGLPE